MVVAADVAERVTKIGWEDLFQDRLARPIGAQASTYYPDAATAAALATRYRMLPTGLTPMGPRGALAKGLPIDPAGSLVSDTDGACRLFQLHLDSGRIGDRRFVSEQSMRQMHTAQSNASGYGLGINRRWMPDDRTKPIIMHGGAFGTVGWANQETGIVGALYIQNSAPLPTRWTQLIYTALAGAGVGRMVQFQMGSSLPTGG